MGMSTGLKNALLGSVGYNTQFDAGLLEFRTGAAPSDADQAPAGSVLASVDPPADCMAAPSGGVVSKQGTWSVAASAAGTIGHARLKQDADLGTTNTTDERQDFTCGMQGANVAISAASIVGGMAQFTCTAHGLANGDMVEITGHSVAAYNRKWIIYNVAANTFQVASGVAVGTGGNARKSFEVVVDNTNVAVGQVITVSQLDTVL